MPSAAQQLAQYGLTVDVARQWIASNLSNPKTVFDVCKNGGIDSTMIAEILTPLAPGLNAATVENFFSSKGLNGSALKAAPMVDLDAGKIELISKDLKEMSWQISMNDNTGELSTETLRKTVLKELSKSGYNDMFDPNHYKGSADGTFTSAELGVSGLESFAATSANLESLFYGTLINSFRSFDQSEVDMFNWFIQTDPNGIKSGDSSLMNMLESMFLSYVKSPTDTPAFDDAAVARKVVNTTIAAAQLVGTYDIGLFQAVFNPSEG